MVNNGYRGMAILVVRVGEPGSEEDEVETEILAALGAAALVVFAAFATRAARGRALRFEVAPVPHEVPRLRLLRRSEQEVPQGLDEEALDRALEDALESALNSERMARRVSQSRAEHYSVLRAQLRPAAGDRYVPPLADDV